MQGDKNWILSKEMNANRYFLDSHWLEICVTEWRERGYGLWFGPLMAMRIEFGAQIINRI